MQQVSAFNIIADVLVFKLSNVICLMVGFAILTVLDKVTVAKMLQRVALKLG